MELKGNDAGDEFGWKFEDNYFDMMPGQNRRIKIFGKHKTGIISAKAHYAGKVYETDWKVI